MKEINDTVENDNTTVEQYETDEIAGTLDEGPGISDTGLETVLKSSQTYRSCLEGTSNGYDIELLNIFLLADGYLGKLKGNNLDKKDLHNEKEMILHKLVSKIGVLTSYFKKDNGSINDEDRSILGRMDFDFKTGKNCVLVPGCLPNLNKLTKLGIINQNNIDINLGDGVNLQESISFVKTSGNLGSLISGKFESNDKLESIKIKTGKNCSFPHGASFYPGDRNDIEITAGNGVFFGINTLIGSGTIIGNDTTIWWGTQVGNNVNLGSNVIIGQSSNIESKVQIPDNCLIPNFSKITNNFSIIEFEEYKKNPNKLVGNRDFVIQLSEKEIKRNKQLEFINTHSHYNFIDRFNKHNVVPENKIFAAIDTVFNFLKETIGFEATKIFKYNTNIDTLRKKLGEKGINEDVIEKLNFGIDGKSRVILKAYPKNSEEFLLEEMPIILSEIEEYISKGILDEKKDYLLKKIEGHVNRPTIKDDNSEITSKDLEENFFGDCYITGKFKFGPNCTFIDLKSRGDELGANEEININNSVFIRGTIHGGGEKSVSDSTIYDLVAHGGVSYKKSSIGEIGKRSVLNNTVVDNSTILGHATMNGTRIKDSELSSDISTAGGSGEGRVIIEDSIIENGVCINTGTEIYSRRNKPISSGKELCENLIITPNKTSAKRL